jgi:AcrR family transcriptional regulator
MVRRPRGEEPETPTPPPPQSNRDKIIAAFMAILAEKRFEEIGFREIATRSGVSLAECRAEFSSTLAILAAQTKATDRRVLEGGDAEMAEEPPRERLFDVLMRRIEALTPHKEAIRSLLRSIGANPGLALAVNSLAVRSQQWMLTAADIDASGPGGLIRAQGLALLYSRVLRVWINDDDPGVARTLSALDRELARADRWAVFLDDLCRFVPRRRRHDRRRARRHGGDGFGEEPATV